ncbi:MAG: efflux RND transporter periplasmic adaptor subunit [Candidatus Methylomirabilales bacterium]
MRRQQGSQRFGVTAFIIGLCLSLTAAGCGEREAVEEKPVPRPVKILTLGQSNSPTQREYPGTIRATQTADMGFEVAGRIIERPVKEGEEVKKGTVLARLDDRDYVASLDTAKAKLRKAEADHRRGMSIYKEDSGAISQARLDRYREELDVARAKLRVAQKAVEDTELRAPFKGINARKLVDDYANVNAKDPVLVFQDTSHLEIEVNVPERDMVGGSKTNEEATAEIKPEVIVSAIPNRTFPARIKEFASKADPETRTFQVTLIFDSPEDVSVLPGMTAKVRVKSAAISEKVRIPAAAALTDESGKAYVWLVDPSSMTVRRTPVEVGPLSGSEVEVHKGLSRGDQVAISGVHQLREGMVVRRFEGRF